MKRYLKLPTVVEAIQFTGKENFDEVWRFLHRGRNFEHGTPSAMQNQISIKTLWGNSTVNPGDWVVKDEDGDFYACKDSVFRDSYVEVTDED